MSPEQLGKFLGRLLADIDKMDIPDGNKEMLKESGTKLFLKMTEEGGCWDPHTQAYLDGMDKLDALIKEKKAGTVCLLHNCEKCTTEGDHEVV